MALFDKISGAVKMAADKGTDMLEIGKLNAKIVGLNSTVSDLKENLGEYYFEQFLGGQALDDEAAEICNCIQQSLDKIAGLHAEIAALKAATSKPEPAPAPKAGEACPACGTLNAEGANFCKECGCKLDKEIAPVKICSSCSSENGADVSFCAHCGTKL